MCRSRLWLLYWVSTQTRRMPALTRLDRAKSTSRYRPPNGTAGLARSAVSGPRPLCRSAGLARSAVSGARRLPAPPASTIPNMCGSAISRLLDDAVTEHAVEDLLSFLLDASEMIGASERLRVELVDVLGTLRPGREPARFRDHFDAAERLAVARRRGEPVEHRLTVQFRHADLVRGQFAQDGLLLPAGGRVDAGVGRVAQPGGKVAVMLAGCAPGDRGDLGSEQRQDDAVLVGGPDPAVAAQEGGPRALLSPEGDAPVKQPGHEPLAPDRHPGQPAPGRLRHPVDD